MLWGNIESNMKMCILVYLIYLTMLLVAQSLPIGHIVERLINS
jgi:hypothetical protein